MPPVGQLNIEDVRGSRRRTLELTGELDLVTAPALEAAVQRVRDDDTSELVLDLRQVVFMDSSGLRTVLAAWDACREDGREFFLIPDRGACRRLFEITGVLDDLPLRAPDEAPAG
jgi:anti-anti-sigma factor